MIDRLERAGATQKEIEQVQANPSLIQRFEAVADQDIHEFLLELCKVERAAKAEVEKVEEDVTGEKKASAKTGKSAESEQR